MRFADKLERQARQREQAEAQALQRAIDHAAERWTEATQRASLDGLFEKMPDDLKQLFEDVEQGFEQLRSGEPEA